MKIIRGHNIVAKEHILTYKLAHKTTLLQAALLTFKDIIRYKHIQIGESYLVYHPIHINTLGVRVAKIIRVYVPKNLRGKGIASQLKDLIPYNTVIEELTDDRTKDKYKTLGTTCLVRSRI